jgi:hypothetical protein
MKLNRRDLLALLGAGATAAQLEAFQHQHRQLQSHPDSYRLQFFTEEQNRLLDELSEMILPADERSPGARGARVSFYIDLVIANSPASVQEQWQTQLAAFNLAGGKPFLELAPRERAALLDRLSRNESRPETPAEKCFVAVKRLTLAGYYTSEVGVRQELRSRSPEVLSRFEGCTHQAGTHR